MTASNDVKAIMLEYKAI